MAKKTIFSARCAFNCKTHGHRRIETLKVRGRDAAEAFEAVARRMRARHADLIEASGFYYNATISPV